MMNLIILLIVKVEKFDLIYDIDLNSKIKELYG
jgi:hypothetical protein